MRHVDGTHKKINNRDSMPIFNDQKISWVPKCATLMAHIKKNKKRDFTPTYKVQKIPWVSKYATLMAHIKKLEIGIPRLFLKSKKFPEFPNAPR